MKNNTAKSFGSSRRVLEAADASARAARADASAVAYGVQGAKPLTGFQGRSPLRGSRAQPLKGRSPLWYKTKMGCARARDARRLAAGAVRGPVRMQRLLGGYDADRSSAAARGASRAAAGAVRDADRQQEVPKALVFAKF